MVLAYNRLILRNIEIKAYDQSKLCLNLEFFNAALIIQTLLF